MIQTITPDWSIRLCELCDTEQAAWRVEQTEDGVFTGREFRCHRCHATVEAYQN